jgi:hypothetical protein
MNVYEVDNDGKFITLGSARNDKMVKAQMELGDEPGGDEGEWEDCQLKWATIYDPDFANKTLNVTIRVYPKAHWVGIEKLNPEGMSDFDIIKKVVGETVKEQFPDFDIDSIDIKNIEGEGSAIDNTPLAGAEHEYEYVPEDSDTALQDKLDKANADDDYDWGPSISSPATAPRNTTPTQAPTYSPGVSTKKPGGGGEQVREKNI